MSYRKWTFIFALSLPLIISCNTYECVGPCGEQSVQVDPGDGGGSSFATSFIISGPLSGEVSTCLGPYSISLVDDDNNGTTYSSDLSFSISGINSFANATCTNSRSNLDIASGTSTGQFYVRENTVGSRNIAVSSTLGLNTLSVQFSSNANVTVALSGPSSGMINECIGPFSYSLEEGGSPYLAPTNTPFTVSGLSAFSDNACNTPLASPSLSAGTSSAMFYLRSSVIATANITATSTYGTANHALSVNPDTTAVSSLLSGPTTANVDSCVGPYSIELRTASNGPGVWPSELIFNLSGNMDFYPDSQCSTNISAINLQAGESSASLYLSSANAGNQTLTASNSNFSDATLVISFSNIANSPSVSISPAVPYNFGDVDVGENLTQFFTITNNGNVRIQNIQRQNSAGSFGFAGIGTPHCDTATIDPGESCLLSVNFAPQSTGAHNASLVADYDWVDTTSSAQGQSSLSISVLGNGTSSAPNGLDPNFATNGAYDSNYLSRVISMKVRSDDSIVILGERSGTDGAIVQLNADGSLYSQTNLDWGSFSATATAMAIQPDGKIIVAAHGLTSSIALARLLPNGNLDTSFSGNGYTGFGTTLVPRDVQILSNGQILIIGVHFSNSYIARFNANGTLDNSFGGGRVHLTSGPVFSQRITTANSVVEYNGQYYVAAGTDCGSGNESVVVAVSNTGNLVWNPIYKCLGDRWNPLREKIFATPTGMKFIANSNGVLFSQFDGDGNNLTQIQHSGVGFFDAVMKTDGTTLVVGQDGPLGARLFAPDNSLQIGFATSDFNNGGTMSPVRGGFQSDGKIILSGSASGQFRVVRFLVP